MRSLPWRKSYRAGEYFRCFANGSAQVLENYIAKRMPLHSPETCIDDCAHQVALLIKSWNLPSDADFDGVMDNIDQCANSSNRETVNALGCFADADRDGVNDSLDKCKKH